MGIEGVINVETSVDEQKAVVLFDDSKAGVQTMQYLLNEDGFSIRGEPRFLN